MKNNIKNEYDDVFAFLNSLPEDKKAQIMSRMKNASPEEQKRILSEIANKLRNKEERPSTPKKEDDRKKEVASRLGRRTLFAGLVVIALALVVLGVFVLRPFVDGKLQKPTESSSMVSEAVSTATPTPIPTNTPIPEPTIIPLLSDSPDLTGMTICIDPGHQAESDYEFEEVASWLDITKYKCTSGARGYVLGLNEYDVTLDYALMLRDYLVQCGANVVLTRDSSEIFLSNQERAMIAVEAEADLFIRLHADGANDTLTSGVVVYVPDSGEYYPDNITQAEALGQSVASEMGSTFVGGYATHIYTGLNYASSIPSYQISLGYLTNSDDEALLNEEETKANVAYGIGFFIANIL